MGLSAVPGTTSYKAIGMEPDHGSRISVIVPSHNRCSSLKRTLDGLEKQKDHDGRMEVIVVADGCTDDTVAMLHKYKSSFPLTVLEQPGQGAAAARNKGAEKASGSLLLFIDDDIVPTETWLQSHISAHRAHPRCIGMGPYYPVRQGRADYASLEVRLWWHRKFASLQEEGHRFTYRDLLSGNLSMQAALFKAVNGFDEGIRSAGGEDYELGARLIQHGIPFRFIPDAVAYHYEHETMNLSRMLKRARQEGMADVHIGRNHSRLRPTLELARYADISSWRGKIVCSLIFNQPTAVDTFAKILFRFLALYEALGLRLKWRRLFIRLRRYWYLRGVVDELGSHNALIKFMQGGPAHTDCGGVELEVDLNDGIGSIEALLDRELPQGLRIRYKDFVVGRIAPQAGAEPLRAAHLRPLLGKSELTWCLGKVLVTDAFMSPEQVHNSIAKGAGKGNESLAR